jgi:hypothetical protein
VPEYSRTFGEHEVGVCPGDLLADGVSPQGEERKAKGESTVRLARNNGSVFRVDGTALFPLSLRSSP